MVIDALSSPHRRSQATSTQPSPFKRPSVRDDFGSWSVLLKRHRFLLTMLTLLAFLCTIYLYFAVTMGATPCSGLTGSEMVVCLEKLSGLQTGKLKF